MSYSRTLFTSRSIAARARYSTSSTSARAPAIACGSARSNPIPCVEPPISPAATSARARSRPVTTTACPSAAYDCASSRPSPWVPPTTMTVPAIPSPLSGAEWSGPLRTGPTRSSDALDGRHRLGRPFGQEVARPQDVVPRLVELAEDVLEVRVDELAVALDRATGDENRIHVRCVGEDDDRAYRIDHGSSVDRVDVQQDDVCLLAGRKRSDLVLQGTGAGTVDRRQLEHVAVRQGRLESGVRRVGECADALLHKRCA